MQIEIKIDDTASETKVIILVNKMTDEVTQIVKKLSDESPQMITGFCGDEVVLLQQSDIVRIYTADSKVFAMIGEKEYHIRLRLYELEERLDKKQFVRISNSEIINLKKVKNFDLSFSGTICISLSNGSITYVSRRYVSRIKQILGM